MSLFWKIFLTFGAAMAATLVATVYVSFQLAREAFDPVTIEEHDPIVLEAAMALADDGEDGLEDWLRANTDRQPGRLLLIIEEDGDDLLDRPVPREMRRLLRFGNRRGGPRRFDGDGDGDGDFDDDDDDDFGRGSRRDRFRDRPPNLRPAQLTPHLIAPDGDEYRLLFVRAPVTVFGLIAWPGSRVAVGGIALLIAALTSLALARYISAPIARLQRASRALARGDLDTRVGGPRRRWADEVGVLSRDFDTMAERIQALITDKETLLRDVSHELRSPLARIRMALALAQRRANEAAHPDLDRIEQEAERLDDLIGQITTLARLRTQREPRRETVLFDELVQTVVEDARYEYPDSTITLESTGPHELLGDPVGLRSAVENVIRNALHYAGDAGPIEVTLQETAGEVSLSVKDSGPGVSEEDLTRIFEPLYRADESRDHRGVSGQGVGLAITARVMELHHGQVSARNRTGGGLEVVLRLPTGPRS